MSTSADGCGWSLPCRMLRQIWGNTQMTHFSPPWWWHWEAVSASLPKHFLRLSLCQLELPQYHVSTKLPTSQKLTPVPKSRIWHGYQDWEESECQPVLASYSSWVVLGSCAPLWDTPGNPPQGDIWPPAEFTHQRRFNLSLYSLPNLFMSPKLSQIYVTPPPPPFCLSPQIFFCWIKYQPIRMCSTQREYLWLFECCYCTVLSQKPVLKVLFKLLKKRKKNS